MNARFKKGTHFCISYHWLFTVMKFARISYLGPEFEKRSPSFFFSLFIPPPINMCTVLSTNLQLSGLNHVRFKSLLQSYTGNHTPWWYRHQISLPFWRFKHGSSACHSDTLSIRTCTLHIYFSFKFASANLLLLNESQPLLIICSFSLSPLKHIYPSCRLRWLGWDAFWAGRACLIWRPKLRESLKTSAFVWCLGGVWQVLIIISLWSTFCGSVIVCLIQISFHHWH